MKTRFPSNKIEFVIGEPYEKKVVNDDKCFSLSADTSLLYHSEMDWDYSLLLGGNWRFELMVDSATGLCVQFQSFLAKLDALHRHLSIPEATTNRVYIKSDELLYPFEGCHYYPFVDKAYWDKRNGILCIGNPDGFGKAVEFTPRITMVINEYQLVCLYLDLKAVLGIDL